MMTEGNADDEGNVDNDLRQMRHFVMGVLRIIILIFRRFPNAPTEHARINSKGLRAVYKGTGQLGEDNGDTREAEVKPASVPPMGNKKAGEAKPG